VGVIGTKLDEQELSLTCEPRFLVHVGFKELERHMPSFGLPSHTTARSVQHCGGGSLPRWWHCGRRKRSTAPVPGCGSCPHCGGEPGAANQVMRMPDPAAAAEPDMVAVTLS
jgi:hypothetical protein